VSLLYQASTYFQNKRCRTRKARDDETKSVEAKQKNLSPEN